MTSQAVEIARVRKPTARATSFVLFVLALSLVVSLYVWTLEPAVPASAVKAIVLLGVLALMGDAWQFVLPRSALASIAFIPYTAMVLVVPHWIALVAIATAKLIESCLARQHLMSRSSSLCTELPLCCSVRQVEPPSYSRMGP
jgi:hypothetical protein